MLLEEAGDRRSAGIGAGRCRAAKRRVQVTERGQERLLKTSEGRPGGAIGFRRWVVRCGWHQKRELAGAGCEPFLWERRRVGRHHVGWQVGYGHQLLRE